MSLGHLSGGVVGSNYRVGFTLDDGKGKLKTGLAGSSFTVRVYPLDQAGVTTPAVTESVQAPGDYWFDVPGSFLTTHGAQNYKVQIQVGATAPTYDAVAGPMLEVSTSDLNLLLYDGSIWIDANNGTAGTTVGLNGTPANPVTTLADAATLAAATGFRSYVVVDGALLLTSSLTEWSVELRGESSLNFNGQNVNASSFSGVGLVEGTMTGRINVHNCTMGDIVGFLGHADGCGWGGTVSLAVGTSTFVRCHSEVPGTQTPTLDFVGAGRKANIRSYSGGMKFENMSDVTNVSTIEYIAGQVIIDGSCTAGTLVVRGIIAPPTDNSAGTTVNLLGALIPDNTDIQRKIITNRLEETPGNPGTLVLYDDDGVTPLLTWLLRDAVGGAVTASVGAPARRSAAT